MDMKNLLQHIIDLRYPTRITRGLRSISPQSPDPVLSSLYLGKELNPQEGLPVSFPRQISRRAKNKNEIKSKSMFSYEQYLKGYWLYIYTHVRMWHQSF